MNDERPNDEFVVIPPIPVQSLEYAIPQEKPERPTHPVVGIMGLLIYGGLFVLFSFAELMITGVVVRHPQVRDSVIVPFIIISSLLGFSGWRAFAALYGTIRTMRKAEENMKYVIYQYSSFEIRH